MKHGHQNPGTPDVLSIQQVAFQWTPSFHELLHRCLLYETGDGVPCGCEEGSGILLVPSSLQKPFQQTTVKATGTLGLSPAKPGTCSHLCHLTGTCFQEAGCGQPLVFHNLGKGSSYLASRVTPEDSDRKDPEPKSHQRAQLGFGFSEQRPCSSSASLPMGPKSPTATFLFLGAWHLHSTSPACARCKLLSM